MAFVYTGGVDGEYRVYENGVLTRLRKCDALPVVVCRFLGRIPPPPEMVPWRPARTTDETCAAVCVRASDCAKVRNR